MAKRIFLLLLCLCLLLPALPRAQAAKDQSEADRICQLIADNYYKILTYTNRRSLSGYCGLMASWELYLLGVNDWVVGYHGNDQFDAYRDVAVTSGGHRVQAYSVQEYSLEEALLLLSRNGTRNVYNILVGLEQTGTKLGSIYGHSVVIYAVLEGTVYFAEGYDTPMGKAGTPLKLSIAEFADFYNGRGIYEGLIYFGKKGYIANCSEYSSNAFLEITQDTALYSQPCAPGTQGAESQFLRTVRRGERLWGNALLQNDQGEFYYQVDDSGTAGYLAAEDAGVFRFIYEDVGISNESHPTVFPAGEDPEITGRIAAEYAAVTGVRMVVKDSAGQPVMDLAMAKHSGVYDFEEDIFSKTVDFSRLPEGTFTYCVYASAENCWLQNGQVRRDSRELLLLEQPFRVGTGEPAPLPAQEAQEKEGWLWENGTWYYFEQGQPRTGWYCYHGGDYYLQADGSVTTGWAVINGKPRYFSATGCMRTGWLDTEQGKMYLLFNGEPATGAYTIDGRVYTFDENGYLIK